jgi:Cu(I)/Ag(I) efflux system membrane protein CusA/SilA
MTDTGAPARPGAIARLVAACARRRGLTLLAVVAAFAWGVASLQRMPLDAIPDLSDVQVIVFSEWPGRGPTLVEDQITYPISATLLSAPRVRYVRGQSFFGLSFVNVIFDDGTDPYWARSRVLEYLSTAAARLPEGVAPRLGPDATGVGWVY